MRIAVLGAGMVGRAIAIDLVNSFDVTSFDLSKHSLSILKSKSASIKTVQTDLKNFKNYKKLLKPFDLVVVAIPGFMGFEVLKSVIEAGKNLVDISFFPENAMQLHALAKQQQVTAIVDCGVAPGLSNLVLGYFDQKMEIQNFHCVVGGLPKQRTQPFEYKAPFSPIDVIEEYTRPARFVENGHIIERPAMSDTELMNFDEIGTLESFNTDGLRSLLYTMRHIPNMKEKTLRYPGHIDLMKKFFNAGFFDDKQIRVGASLVSVKDFSCKVLFDKWKLGETEEEFTVMRIKIDGKQNGKKKSVVYELFDQYDQATQTSSMARTTGYTCTAAVHLMANGLFNKKGVYPPELIGKDVKCFEFILAYLKTKGISFTVIEKK